MNGVVGTVSDVMIPAAAVIATVVGILLAQNYSRQMALKLSQTLWGSSIRRRGLTCGWAGDLPGGYAAGSYWLIKPPRI
jgi:hypothetical protein